MLLNMETSIKPNTHSDSNAPDEKWLTEVETAMRLRMSKKWLQKARTKGGGPRFAKFGSAVRYAVSDIEQFEKSRLRSSTSDHGGY